MTPNPPDPEPWTRAADQYSSVIGPTTAHGTRRLVDIIHACRPFTAHSRVLDVGAGTGSLAHAVRARGPPGMPILALDCADGMLAALERQRLPGVTTVKGDARRLEEIVDEEGAVEGAGDDGMEGGGGGGGGGEGADRGGSPRRSRFSHTLCSFVIQFVAGGEPNELGMAASSSSSAAAACVRSMCRVTEPGGVVGIAIWGEKVGVAALHERACMNLDPGYVPPPQTTRGAWHSEARHEDELRRAGLENVETEVVEMPFEAGSWQGVVDYWFHSTNPVPRTMIRHWVDHGGSRAELEGEYTRLVGDMYDRGEMIVCEAVLGWGTKPLVWRVCV